MTCPKCQTKTYDIDDSFIAYEDNSGLVAHSKDRCIAALVAQRDEARANGKMIAQAADRMRAHVARAVSAEAKLRIAVEALKRITELKSDDAGWVSTARWNLAHDALAALKPSEDT